MKIHVHVSESAADPAERLATLRKEVRSIRAAIGKLNTELASQTKALETKEKQVAALSAKLKQTTEKPSPKQSISTKPGLEKLPEKFDKGTMFGKEWFDKANGSSKRRAKVEGYWRTSLNKGLSSLPFPIPYKVKGFNKASFIASLLAKQKIAKLGESRGMSPDRWSGAKNGSKEYSLDGWSWPSGYIKYVRHDVPPSRAFYKFIMGKDLTTLPTYGRE